MSRARGGYIGFNRTAATSAINSAASGVWTVREAEALKRAGTWPIASPSLWLDASASNTLFDATTGGSLVAANGQIARWEDKSGNGNHFTQATAANRPIRKASLRNGLDVVQTSAGNNQRMQSSISFPASDYTVFAAFSPTEDDVNFRYVLEWTNFGTVFAYRGRMPGRPGFYQFNEWRDATAATAPVPHVLSWTLDSASGATIHSNNVQVGTSLSYTTRRTWGGTSYIFGDSGNVVFLYGDFFELIVFRSVMSSAERAAITNYLLAKWLIS
jgi:hypothetical protein